jgi:hypothetical protein
VRRDQITYAGYLVCSFVCEAAIPVFLAEFLEEVGVAEHEQDHCGHPDQQRRQKTEIDPRDYVFGPIAFVGEERGCLFGSLRVGDIRRS